jgi:glycosyltransferase involved in cell wall biosynthesis
LHPKKGLDLLLPAFAALARRVPDARLVLVGPGEPDYVADLSARASASGISDRVAFLGPLTGREKWAAFSAATVFALPSYQENFAITVVEAMSAGTPVLLSRRVNIWPEVEIARAGVISELDSARIADNLVKIVGNNEFVDLLGRNARAFVQQTYNWDRTTDATEIAYRSVLSKPPPA